MSLTVVRAKDGTFWLAEEYNPSLKVSALVTIAPETLLVQERTDRTSARSGTTGRPHPPLEGITDPAVAGVPVLPKTLVIDFTGVAGVSGKIEGVAVVNPWTLALLSDGPAALDANGRLVDTNIRTQMVYVRRACHS